MKYEIYTNYNGMKPTELEEIFETMEEVTAWCEEFEKNATEEESYIVKLNGKEIMIGWEGRRPFSFFICAKMLFLLAMANKHSHSPLSLPSVQLYYSIPARDCQHFFSKKISRDP